MDTARRPSSNGEVRPPIALASATRRLAPAALALSVLAAAVVPLCAQPVSGPAALTADQWREDLRVLADKVRTEHRYPWSRIAREDFDKAVAALDERLPSLSDQAIVVEMARLVASLGDGHSRLSLPLVTGEAQGRAHTSTPLPAQGALLMRQYPVRLHLFDDGLFVTGATAEHLDLIGMEVTRYASKPIAEVLKAVRPVSNVDNEVGHRLYGPRLLGIAEVCGALGVVRDPERLALTLRDRAGKASEIVVAPLPASVAPKFVQAHERPGAPLPLWLKDLERPHWFQPLPERRAVFAQINAIRDAPDESMAQFAARLASFVESNPVDRVVIDLRWNGGGNNYLNRSLILALARVPRLGRFGAVITLTSRYTFSAAMNLVSSLEVWTGSLFAGEATGTTPSHYGDARQHTLPRSGLIVRLSSVYWRDWNVNERRAAVEPDLPVPMNAADYFDGRDPVLEAALAFRAPEGIADQLLWTFERSGLDGAGRRLYLLRSEPELAGVDFVAELRRAGRTLLDRGQPRDAVTVFQQNLRERPAAFESHADLGEALLAAGDRAQAVTSLEKALSIRPGDPRVAALLEKARRP